MNEAQKDYLKRYYKNHQEKIIAYRKLYYQQHKERFKIYRKAYKSTHKSQTRQGSKRRRQEVKVKTLTHYGNGKLACVQCGYGDIRALCLDHIYPSLEGSKRRMGGERLYRYLEQQDYPEGYQTLCANCNYIKEFEIDLQESKYGTIH